MPLPLQLQIPLPHDIPLQRGRHATSPPHGRRVTINMTTQEYERVIQALSRMDTPITLSNFIRQVAFHAAEQVILHTDEEIRNRQTLDGNS